MPINMLCYLLRGGIKVKKRKHHFNKSELVKFSFSSKASFYFALAKGVNRVTFLSNSVTTFIQRTSSLQDNHDLLIIQETELEKKRNDFDLLKGHEIPEDRVLKKDEVGRLINKLDPNNNKNLPQNPVVEKN